MREPSYLEQLTKNISIRGGHVDTVPESNLLNAQLEAPLDVIDVRPHRIRAPESAKHSATFNQLYNSLRSRDVLDSISDFTITGTATLTNAAVNTIAINMPLYARPINIQKWPDGTQYYFMIRIFSIMPTTAGAVGDWQSTFVDSAGNVVALGDINAATGIISQPGVVCGSPLTDPGIQNVGSLVVNWLGGAAPVTIGYTIGLSLIFLKPASQQYEDNHA